MSKVTMTITDKGNNEHVSVDIKPKASVLFKMFDENACTPAQMMALLCAALVREQSRMNDEATRKIIIPRTVSEN